MTDFLRASLARLCPEQTDLLCRLAQRTADTAAKMNITARKSDAEIVFYHIADSLTLLEDVKGARTVCDVGTGGGFPGLVLAALCPETEFVLMDSTKKKVLAIEETARALGLTNVRGLAARAEEAGRGALRESFDVVVSRALAALPMLSELCLPLVRVGGTFAAMKGRRAEEEIADARRILSRLSVLEPNLREEVLDAGRLLAEVSVPPSEEERAVLEEFCQMRRVTCLFGKTRPTPSAYPRTYQKILKDAK